MEISRPLFELQKKKISPIKDEDWSQACEKAFQAIKKCYIEAPLLHHPDYSKKFVIFCDASKYGVGGVLTQEKNGKHVPLGFLVKSLTRHK